MQAVCAVPLSCYTTSTRAQGTAGHWKLCPRFSLFPIELSDILVFDSESLWVSSVPWWHSWGEPDASAGWGGLGGAAPKEAAESEAASAGMGVTPPLGSQGLPRRSVSRVSAELMHTDSCPSMGHLSLAPERQRQGKEEKQESE